MGGVIAGMTGLAAALDALPKVELHRHIEGRCGPGLWWSLPTATQFRCIDPTSYLPAYEAARTAGFRLTAHQGENSPASAIAACIDVLRVERIDHGLSIMEDADVVARAADARIPLTVCPTPNILIGNAFPRLEDHVYPQMRAAGLLATVNTDDPALIDLNLGTEYGAIAAAFGYAWHDMVEIALDGVEASWLDETAKSALRQQITSTPAPND